VAYVATKVSDDYVIATNEVHSLKEFVELVFHLFKFRLAGACNS